MKKLTLVRHASTLENEQARYIGSTDSPLSANGTAEASQLAALLADCQFDQVWCSPMQRAKQTLAIFAEALSQCGDVEQWAGKPSLWQDMNGLREVDFGRWEGQTFAELVADFEADFQRWKEEGDTFEFPGGESIADFRRRVAGVIEQVELSEKSSILIVTHGGVIRQIICHYLGLPASQSFSFKVEPASVTTFDLHDAHAVLTSLNVRGA